MHTNSVHTANIPHRRLIAMALTVMYLTIVLSPLASLAMYSTTVAHVVTGECSGDCNICGCSPESRANHTCCCAKKKQQQDRVSADRCSIQPPAISETAEMGCCASSKPAEPVAAENDCCARSRQSQLPTVDRAAQVKEKRSENETVYKCGCPCDKGKLLSLAGSGTSEILPYIFSEGIRPPYEVTLYSCPVHRMPSLCGEPPDPPPKLPVQPELPYV